MFTRMVIVSVCVASIIGFSYPASAASPSILLDETVWKIDGNIKTTIHFPNLASLSLTLPKLGSLSGTSNMGEVFHFAGDRTLEDLIVSFLPLLAGNAEVPLPTWTQNGSNFTVDLTELSLALAAGLQSTFSDLATVDGIPIKSSFIGKVAADGKSISGKVDIACRLSIDTGKGKPPTTGTFSIAMIYKGTPATQTQVQAIQSALSKAQSSKGSELLSAMKQILSDMKSLIPHKGTPQKPSVK